MKLFSLPDGTVDRKDRAQWLTPIFDLAYEEEVVDTALIGPWTPIHCKSSNARLTAQSTNTRIPCVSANKRLET